MSIVTSEGVGPQRPVWLLDIDGVVNALAPRVPPDRSDRWSDGVWREHVVHTDVAGRGRVALSILVAEPVLRFVTAVHESGAAEIRWHSTWGDAAITALAPALGLPAFELSEAPEWAAQAAMWWKIPAARHVAESGRRLVWTDDQLALYRDDPLCADELAALERWDGALLIAPQPRTGLVAADLDRIAAFLGVERD